MPTLKHAKILVIRNPMEKIAKCVPLHEIPILRDVHGAGAISVVDDNVPSDLPVPDLEAEFERLKSHYGMHHELPMPYVEHVYGAPLTGGLGRALEAATDSAAPKKTARAA